MPYETVWAEPGLFFTHNGVNVFHTYKDDDIEQGENRHHYTLNATSDEDHFDVRDFDTLGLLKQHPPYIDTRGPAEEQAERRALWDAWFETGEPAALKAVIAAALDDGRLVPPADTDENEAFSEEA